MVWGSNPRPTQFCSYKDLDAALKAKTKGHTDKIYVWQRYVYAYRSGDDIQLCLHRTDIVTYHLDGTLTLRGADWLHSAMTRHWLWIAARKMINYHKANSWTPKQWIVDDSLFYDEMKLSGRGGQIMGKIKPPIMHVPNAEAKALRKHLTQVQKMYMAYARMETHPRRTSMLVQRYGDLTLEFDWNTYVALTESAIVHPVDVLKLRIAGIYRQTVLTQELYDVVPAVL